MTTENELQTIQRKYQYIRTTYAAFPAAAIPGQYAYATDRKVLYQWSGTAWESMSVFTGSGLAADIPAAADLPDGSIYYETDTALTKQVQSGVWAGITPAKYEPVYGTYTGNDVSSRQITTGMKCRCVFIYTAAGSFCFASTEGYTYPGWAWTGSASTAYVRMHASDGFVVRVVAHAAGMNVNTTDYWYIAFPE